MKRYKMEIDDSLSEFFEEIALIVQRPVEEILSDALFKQVEIISLKVLDSGVANNKTLL